MIKDTSATDRTVGPIRRRTHMAWWLGGAALVAIIAGLLMPVWLAEETLPRERVRLAVVEQGTLVRDVSAQGRVVAARSPSLYTLSAGIVRFEKEPGAQVKKGDVLAVIDSPERMSELKREEAALAKLRAEVQRQAIGNRRVELEKKRAIDAAEIAWRAAKREAERAQWAFDKGAIAEVDYKRTQDTLAGAVTTLDAARADLELERDALKLSLQTFDEEAGRQQLLVDELNRQVRALEVRAPFDGIVGNWLTTDMASVAPNQALLTVVDLTELEVEAAVPEVYAESLNPGQPAEITVGGERLRGELRLVSPEVQNAQVLARVRLTDPAALRQNQRVQVRVLLEEKPDVLIVERGPIFERDGSFAWVVEGDVARRQPIRLGASSVTEFEVISGLAAGQQVIVAGIDELRGVDEVLLTR